MWTVPESSFSKTAKCSNRTRCYWEWWWGEQWKKTNSDRLRPAERLGTLGSVEHSMLQVIQLTLFQTLTLLATPASCSWTLQPVFIRASETTVHQAVLGLWHQKVKKPQKKPLCLFCVLLAFCILMWHTFRHSGTTRCGGAGCVGTGMHMQQIAQIETELCWLDTGAKNNSG